MGPFSPHGWTSGGSNREGGRKGTRPRLEAGPLPRRDLTGPYGQWMLFGQVGNLSQAGYGAGGGDPPRNWKYRS